MQFVKKKIIRKGISIIKDYAKIFAQKRPSRSGLNVR